MPQGPTKTSELSVISTVTGSEKVIAIATVNGSLQTVQIAISVITGYTPPALDSLSDVSIQNLTDGYVLKWSSASQQYVLGNLSQSFTSLTDVSLSAVSDGQLMVYNSAVGQWLNQTVDYVTSSSLASALSPYITSASASSQFASVTHSHTLDGLSDVSAVSPSDGQTLSWSSAQSQWIPGTPAAGIGAIASATDVSVSALTEGDTLIWNSVSQEWENRAGFLTSASASVMMAAQLTPYITSASVATALSPYITSASVSAAIVNFITSASASTLAETIISNTLINDLSNVSVSSAVEGQLLVWNSVAQEFQNQTLDLPTSASVSIMITAALLDYPTSTEVSTMISAANVSFITSTSTSALIATLLGPYVLCAQTNVKIGASASALSSDFGVVIGADAKVSGSSGVAIGNFARTFAGAGVIALGASAVAGGAGAIAIGYTASAGGVSAMAFGAGALTGSGQGGIAIGSDAVITSGSGGIVIGKAATVDASGAVAIGASARTCVVGQIKLGKDNETHIKSGGGIHWGGREIINSATLSAGDGYIIVSASTTAIQITLTTAGDSLGQFITIYQKAKGDSAGIPEIKTVLGDRIISPVAALTSVQLTGVDDFIAIQAIAPTTWLQMGRGVTDNTGIGYTLVSVVSVAATTQIALSSIFSDTSYDYILRFGLRLETADGATLMMGALNDSVTVSPLAFHIQLASAAGRTNHTSINATRINLKRGASNLTIAGDITGEIKFYSSEIFGGGFKITHPFSGHYNIATGTTAAPEFESYIIEGRSVDLINPNNFIEGLFFQVPDATVSATSNKLSGSFKIYRVRRSI
jgi:hypothetical protein